MNDELYHHGILGQKWGVRRFQNKDGSLTSSGKTRRKIESTSEKQKKSGVGKKVLKIGRDITLTLLVSYGMYKIATSNKFQNKVYNTMYGKKFSNYDPFEGYELVKKTPISSLK